MERRCTLNLFDATVSISNSPILSVFLSPSLSPCSFLCLGSVGGCSKYLNDLALLDDFRELMWPLVRVRECLGHATNGRIKPFSDLIIIRFCFHAGRSVWSDYRISFHLLGLIPSCLFAFAWSCQLFSSVHNRPGCSHLTHQLTHACLASLTTPSTVVPFPHCNSLLTL